MDDPFSQIRTQFLNIVYSLDYNWAANYISIKAKWFVFFRLIMISMHDLDLVMKTTQHFVILAILQVENL